MNLNQLPYMILPHIQWNSNFSVDYHVNGYLNIGNKERTFMKIKNKGDAYTQRIWRHPLCLFTGYMSCILIIFLQLQIEINAFSESGN